MKDFLDLAPSLDVLNPNSEDVAFMDDAVAPNGNCNVC